MTFGRWYSKEKSKSLLCWHSWRMETRFVSLRIFFFFCLSVIKYHSLFSDDLLDCSTLGFLTLLSQSCLCSFFPSSIQVLAVGISCLGSPALLSLVLHSVCGSSSAQQAQHHCLLQTSNRHIFLLFSSNENQTPQCDI